MKPLFLLLLISAVWAQNSTKLDSVEIQRLQTTPLPTLEKELAELGHTVLRHETFQYKDYSNSQFLQKLAEILKRPDSYAYRFDSLNTVSIIGPEDNSFRIFTWVLVDQDSLQTYQNYYHFGLIQKPVQTKDTSYVGVVILNDKLDRTSNIENDILNPTRWLGALYYHPKETEHGVLTYSGTYARRDGMTGKMIKQKVNYYVVMGFNGHNRLHNYKILDVISFPDEENPLKVEIGAPIFYFGQIPKSRAVFRYGDHTLFSMNKGYFSDPKGKKKNEAIIFDHLASPYRSENDTLDLRVMLEQRMGADGSYDALVWLNKVNKNRKGFFYFLKNVDVYHPEMEHLDPKEQEAIARKERERLHQMNAMPTRPRLPEER